MLPGAFHIKMAAADTIWRTHIQQKNLNDMPTGIFSFFNTLFPNKSAKISSNPPFQMLHDGIGYLAQSYILNACNEVCLEVHKKELEPWVKSNPTWESIIELCASVFKTKVAGPEFDNLCSPYAHSNTCDKIHENQLLANCDLLCYMALSDAMNHGDIGLVTDLLWMWVPMFRGCGKHKYATHLLCFLTKLHQYPEPLTHAILLNWFCNPSGKEGGFHGYDWLVEQMNLYVKVY